MKMRNLFAIYFSFSVRLFPYVFGEKNLQALRRVDRKLMKMKCFK